MLSKAKLWLSLAVGTLLLWSTGAHAAWELNMPSGVTQSRHLRPAYDNFLVDDCHRSSCIRCSVMVYH